MQEIYEDYEKNHYNKLKDLACKLVTVLNRRKDCERRSVDTGFGMVHTIFGRAKNPEHLIEKIIRKPQFARRVGSRILCDQYTKDAYDSVKNGVERQIKYT